MKSDAVLDLIVVGAGAAGLMTAINAGRKGIKTLLLDRREVFGAKIIMSGGTWCNLTNETVTEKDFASRHRHFVLSALKAFTPQEAVFFFEEIGVKVVSEPGGKLFPSTHSGKTVLDALITAAHRSGVQIRAPYCVENISKEGTIFSVKGEAFEFKSRTLVLSTGGLSFPTTGSTGIGYRIAADFGHGLVQTSPSLTPLLSDDLELRSLSGVSVPARLDLYEHSKKTLSFSGALLFTHLGFSGPAALNISRHWIRSSRAAKPRIVADFCPHSNPETMRKQLIRQPSLKQKTPVGFLEEFLPKRLVRVLLNKSRISTDTALYSLKKEDRENLLKYVFSCPLGINGDLGYAKAEVTAGGIDLAEIRQKDMQSKRVPGLFFSGEILDADGRIGGFNFQWAWSTGAVAANGIRGYLKEFKATDSS